MGEQHVVGCRQRVLPAVPARSVHGLEVSEERCDPRFVDGDPVLDTVAQPLRHRIGIVGKGLDSRSLRPPTTTLQSRGQVPVIERRARLDAGFEQLVDEAVVEVEADGAYRSRSFRNHPRPGDREPIRIDAEFAHQANILLIAMDVIARDFAARAVGHIAFDVDEVVPDRPAAPVGAAFDLIGRGRNPPREALGSRHVDGIVEMPRPSSRRSCRLLTWPRPGGMAERTKATVLKTVEPLAGSLGSNPSPSAFEPGSARSRLSQQLRRANG